MKKKLLALTIVAFSVLFMLTGCKKKHNWHEVGGETAPAVEHFGVQYSKGTESNPAHVFIASIFVPTGRDKKGNSTFKTIMYELEELTPENLHYAMVDCGVITADSLFVDFVTFESDKSEEMGPGAVGKKKTLDGTVRYVDVESNLDNSDDYIDPETGNQYEDERIEGLIDVFDIYDAINKTFMENYQLVDCGYSPANMDDYRKAHNTKK